MILRIKQGTKRGVMTRKWTQGTTVITEEDLEQVDAYAKKYGYEVGYCDVELVEYMQHDFYNVPKRIVHDTVTHIL